MELIILNYLKTALICECCYSFCRRVLQSLRYQNLRFGVILVVGNTIMNTWFHFKSTSAFCSHKPYHSHTLHYKNTLTLMNTISTGLATVSMNSVTIVATIPFFCLFFTVSFIVFEVPPRYSIVRGVPMATQLVC